MGSKRQGDPEVVISIDGKTLRGTIAQGETRGVHLLAAYELKTGLVLMEVAVESKENEIIAAPKYSRVLIRTGQS
jgi:hypothetical protein